MWAEVEAILEEGLAQGLFPGCALAVRDADALLYSRALGQAEIAPNPRPVQEDLAWDLASLSKVLCGVPVAMSLVAEGRLDLDAPLRELLGDAPKGVSARHALSHSSGLPPWRALYDEAIQGQLAWGSAETRAHLLRLARTTPVMAAPGACHTYSDLGFLLLCAALEAVGGARIDQLYAARVAAPSGADLRFGWPGAAATELCPVRGSVVVGTVHDLNAAALGGLSTHAGLFGAASSVAAAGAWQLRAWLGEAGAGLEPAVVRRFWSEGGAGSHRLGWDSPTPGGCSAGDRWPLDGVGHLGFTGTSVWIDRDPRLVVVLLTNRVVFGPAGHPRWKAFRPAFHDGVRDLVGLP